MRRGAKLKLRAILGIAKAAMKAPQHLLLHLGVAMPVVHGAIHNLFVGNLYTPAAIYALEFNDETNDFRIVQNHTADASHAWITFDVSIPLLELTTDPLSDSIPA